MSYINSQSLLSRAHAELDAAHGHVSPRERFIHAHMAALRAAAAILALHPGPGVSRRKKLRSAWAQLGELGPQWEPWVQFYEASAQTRAALESGQIREIESEQSGNSLAVATQFVTLVEETLAEQEKAFRALAQAS